jgi:hypothetical protein
MTVEAGRTGADRIGLEDVDLPRLGMAAMRFIKAIERGQHGVLWDAASDAIRTSTPRDLFISSLAHRHHVLGRGLGRRWTAVRVDQPVRADRLPGTYALLEFSVSFGEGARHREMVTLRREEQGIWRLAGYGIRAA